MQIFALLNFTFYTTLCLLFLDDASKEARKKKETLACTTIKQATFGKSGSRRQSRLAKLRQILATRREKKQTNVDLTA